MLGASAQPAQPARLVRDVLLRDGSTLRLQAPTSADYDDIKVFYDQLSPESRFFRFHGFGRTDTVARAAADASGIDRVALVGRHEGKVVAACDYQALREPGVAEIAFAVADDDQRRGIGTRMLEQLAAVAAERGIRRFDAAVLSNNQLMLGVFRNAGFAVRREGFGELTVSLDITPTDTVRERIDERDHYAAIASLRPLLAPTSIAVVGAAEMTGNVGRVVLANIAASGFEGVVTPVNRDGGVVCSRPAARSLDELERVPELVIIAAAGDEVLELAAQAAAKGARALLVVPAGPDDEEQDEGAQAREERLLAIVRDAGLRLVGPNSLGVLNTDPDVNLNATFSGAGILPGALAICSSSGAIGIGLLGHAAARRLGVSMFASLGNLADVSTNDLLECWEHDERTAAVLLYVHTFGNPERFTRIARRVSRIKPILALKGRQGAERVLTEAHSHTAAALRGDAVVDALLHQGGVLRFREAVSLFNAAEFFERQPLPRGRRIGIVSNSAGVATLAADACATRGLEVKAATHAPNPHVIGVGAGPAQYSAGVRGMLDDNAIDALMVFYIDIHDGDPEGVLDMISAVSEGQSKPVVASVVRSDGRRRPRTSTGVPNFLFPESCADVLARAAERSEWLSRPLGQAPDYPDLDPQAARAVIASFLEREPAGGWLSVGESEALLTSHGIPVCVSHRCANLEQAVAVAAEIDHPVAIKADFPAPAHATDVDAVLVELEGEAAIRSGWRELERRVRAGGREWRGALVQRVVAPGGTAVLVGAVADPDLGPVLAVGPGGRQAAHGLTAAFRLLPVTDADADELIDSSEIVAAELDGFRGGALLDRKALRDLILRFALLIREVPDVVEADLNPVRCMTTGCMVLDMRLRIEHRAPIERVKTW
jgi:acyl-CoA synthetase (NDP forming)/ribosomal protein S18 acetylase RimI-like enzyme